MNTTAVRVSVRGAPRCVKGIEAPECSDGRSARLGQFWEHCGRDIA